MTQGGDQRRVGATPRELDDQLADVEQLDVVRVEVADQLQELDHRRVEHPEVALGPLIGQTLDRGGDEPVAGTPDVSNRDFADLQEDPERDGSFGDRRMTHARTTTDPATYLDEALLLEDPQRLAHDPLRDAGLDHQFALHRQRLPDHEVASGNSLSELGGNGNRSFCLTRRRCGGGHGGDFIARHHHGHVLNHRA